MFISSNVLIHVADEKDDSIVRIGCHEISNQSLSEVFYLSRNAKFESNTNTYCPTIMKTLAAPLNITTRSNFVADIQNRNDDGISASESTLDVMKIDQLDTKKLQQCSIAGTAEINCEGCDVRFYHNRVDRDFIFNPSQEEGELKDEELGRV